MASVLKSSIRLSRIICRKTIVPRCDVLMATRFNLNRNIHNALSSIQTNFPHCEPAVLCLQQRCYAKKGKNINKQKKGKKVTVSAEDLSEVVNFDQFKDNMNLTLESLQRDYVQQLVLQTSAESLENLMVETKDGKFPLIQLGQLAMKSQQLLVINLDTSPQYIQEVVAAIINSGKNLNPQQDGTTLFIQIPKVTRERREALAKSAKTLCTKTKDKLRDVQNKFLRDVSKNKTASEDIVKDAKEAIMATTQEYNGKAEQLMAQKQKELLGK